MDPAVNKRNHAPPGHPGPWGHLDRTVYHYPFGDYVYRSVSGYGQEDVGSGYGVLSIGQAFLVGGLIGFIAGQQVERKQK